MGNWRAGLIYKTLSGHNAVIYCTNAPGDFPIHGRIEGRQAGAPMCWDRDGNSSVSLGRTHSLNLADSKIGKVA